MPENQSPQIVALVSHTGKIETRTLRGMFTDRMVVTIDGETFATRPANFHERDTAGWQYITIDMAGNDITG
jgi:hypothetical protein